LIGDLAGEERLFRPFGGDGMIDQNLLNPLALDHLERNEFTVVLWTCVPRDWEDPDGWVDRAIAECDKPPWSVVVLHDIPGAGMERLDHFLTLLKARGASFTQEFPSTVLPRVRGQRRGDMLALTTPL
jgi:peptidoglycan-N-acetylglucosamine deacetylase